MKNNFVNVKIFSGVTISLLMMGFAGNAQLGGKAYYINIAGNDAGPGSKKQPWKTITKLNETFLHAGDTVFFAGGQIFRGSINIDSIKKGVKGYPVVITSSGNGSAIIHSGNTTGVTVYNTEYVGIEKLLFVGSGRKKGNTKNGIFIVECRNIFIDKIDVQGYQKAGLEIYSSLNVQAQHVYAHDNGAAGISVSGDHQGKAATKNILLKYCRAENNPGDPGNLANHSGNGIIAGHCTNVTIEYCSATNNGWDMPRIGNGPVGIWMYEADSVLIQYCIAYRNKTSKGAADGGGFDIDGGVTNSVIQYCLSYENYGSGFGIFQYYEASPWYNNTIRYCISVNDGLVSDARSGVYIWNSQGDSGRFHHCYFYNNTIFNTRGTAINYSELSKNKDFYFYNNIFVAKDSLIKGAVSGGTYLGNNWWSLGKFSMERMPSLQAWARYRKQEYLNGSLVGSSIDPGFKNPGKINLTDPSKLKYFYNYTVPANSPLHNRGVDLKTFGISQGAKNFNQQPASSNSVGAAAFNF